MIRTYQAAHGGMVFDTAPTRRQKTFRNRMAALAVIAAVAASAGVLQHFKDNLAPDSSAAPSLGAYSIAR